MKFFIISRSDELSNRLMGEAREYLEDFGMEWNEESPQIVLSIGGDGTLLHAFHKYSDRLNSVAFVGIHTGHLGFYADWKPIEIEKLVLAIAKKEFEVIEYPLLEVTVHYRSDQESSTYLALNESTVKSPDVTLVMDVFLNDSHFERFRGDGLCMSTPSGSTAYNKALGGAIIHPSLPAMQLTEMASINNRVFRTVGSPLVLPSHHRCTLLPVKAPDFMVTIDHLQLLHKDVESIEYRVAKEKVRFARFRAFPFWRRVHDSFIDSELSED
ncbi:MULTISPECIES: NAD kinase [unclassified Planococcus (in: firmicutes)]|uniref:NAD kinase n=1 Tax=Planococcus TaxID=1372 RepID=UPI000C32AB7D|nr:MULTISPECIES: NAD kinase [unclassified Planococcus (in: firmicutes)]AUD14259.1 NAD kinase [Planococcus sp. MB-3u-03]PKG48290.1 NAD kinase [Planococcus sp. Urea-trap-24]PKG92137.1 NAD kinase [Planococcus sp. Urea-3u-39]PKH42957.1 NAD kinase [Planococcus sp. MB-3u-09]